MIEFTAREINRIAKIAKKEAAKRDKYEPQLISVYKMCEEYGVCEYFSQIRNRIYFEAEQNKELYQHILITPSNTQDINLTSTGLFLSLDVLAGYFPLNDMTELYKYWDKRDKCFELQFNYKQMLRARSKQQLKDMLEEITNREVTPEQQPGNEYNIRAIQDEIARRPSFGHLFRASGKDTNKEPIT